MIGLTVCVRRRARLFNGTPEWGPIYSGYLGLALLASTLVVARARGVRVHIQSGRLRRSSRSASRSSFGWSTRWAVMLPDGSRAASSSACRCWRVSRHSRPARCTPSTLGFFISSDLAFTVHRDARTRTALRHVSHGCLRARQALGWFLRLAGSRRCCCSSPAARLPLALRLGRVPSDRSSMWPSSPRRSRAAVLANVALTLNDAHVDLTREKIYTPVRAGDESRR